MTDGPLPLSAAYNGTAPTITGKLAFAGDGAVVLGRTTMGDGAWLGAYSVIRADGHNVVIGNDFHLGGHATVHIAHDIYPTHIGDRVTVGTNAVVHACTVGDDCVVERDAVILDGAVIGAGAVITAGSVVFPRHELAGGWLYSGSPAKPVAQVSAADLAGYHQKIRGDAPTPAKSEANPEADLDCFVAPSARIGGQVKVAEGVGIWYGCRLLAHAHRIIVGEGTNIQDNSLLVCETGDITIAPDVTVGHNVTLHECTIETGSLIGIGSLVAPGTIVESEVLVAAGTQTEPGQRLHAGQVWAGHPARPIAPLKDSHRHMMAATLPVYRQYADTFRNTAHVPLKTAEGT